ncbi:hypothetical protein NQD34_005017 [Periophthalmus magnuspinnatus]|nr:hypothetical protein NQD34_005017 [Periophthalmus magnuspinnatus]
MTLLAGEGSEYDFSAVSCASDPPPLHELEPQKGVYYRRARLAPQLCTDLPLSSARRLYAIINVGGLRYQLPWTTLEDFPLSRLGQLRLCSSFDDIMQICADYDVTHNEFFFDRSPCAFRTILAFLRAGKLRAVRDMCALSFREELLYWGVPEDNLEWCCRRRVVQRVEEFEALERAEEEEMLEEMLDTDSREAPKETRVNRCMGQLRDMVERPHSGLPGKIFACLSVLFVTITAVTLSISTMPALREEEEEGTCSRRCYNIFIIETVCVAWFSLEFSLRFIQDREQTVFPATAPEPHRPRGHPAVLHLPPGRQLAGRGQLRELVSGQGRSSPPGSPSSPDLVRDAFGASLPRTSNFGTYRSPLYEGIRFTSPVPVRGDSSLLPSPVPH